MVSLGIRFSVLLCLSGFAATAMSGGQVTGFDRWAADLRYEFGDKGINADLLEKTMASVQLDIPAESWDSMSAERYLKHFLSAEMMAYAKNVEQQYSPILKNMSQEYGIQERYLVALLTVTGAMYENESKYPVVDVLISQAYKQNSVSARLELENALRLLEKTGLDKQSFKGNSTGAFGVSGMKPSVFNRNAVDYNNDGVVDVWKASADTLATTANGLKQLGWHGNEIWGRAVKLPQNFNLKLLNANQQRSINSWKAAGIKSLDGSELPDEKMQASLVSMGDRTYMVYNNYFTLLRWQRSDKFALAVALLSDAIGQPQNMEEFPFAAAQ